MNNISNQKHSFDFYLNPENKHFSHEKERQFLVMKQEIYKS